MYRIQKLIIILTILAIIESNIQYIPTPLIKQYNNTSNRLIRRKANASTQLKNENLLPKVFGIQDEKVTTSWDSLGKSILITKTQLAESPSTSWDQRGNPITPNASSTSWDQRGSPIVLNSSSTSSEQKSNPTVSSTPSTSWDQRGSLIASESPSTSWDQRGSPVIISKFSSTMSSSISKEKHDSQSGSVSSNAASISKTLAVGSLRRVDSEWSLTRTTFKKMNTELPSLNGNLFTLSESNSSNHLFNDQLESLESNAIYQSHPPILVLLFSGLIMFFN